MQPRGIHLAPCACSTGIAPLRLRVRQHSHCEVSAPAAPRFLDREATGGAIPRRAGGDEAFPTRRGSSHGRAHASSNRRRASGMGPCRLACSQPCLHPAVDPLTGRPFGVGIAMHAAMPTVPEQSCCCSKRSRPPNQMADEPHPRLSSLLDGPLEGSQPRTSVAIQPKVKRHIRPWPSCETLMRLAVRTNSLGQVSIGRGRFQIHLRSGSRWQSCEARP